MMYIYIVNFFTGREFTTSPSPAPSTSRLLLPLHYDDDARVDDAEPASVAPQGFLALFRALFTTVLRAFRALCISRSPYEALDQDDIDIDDDESMLIIKDPSTQVNGAHRYLLQMPRGSMVQRRPYR